MFKELLYRKEVGFRYDCYIAGISAADYRNAHRTKDSDKIVSPLDYTVGEDEVDEEREQAKQNIRSAWAMANGLKPLTKEESALWRQRRVKNLINDGFSESDAVRIMEEAFEG